MYTVEATSTKFIARNRKGETIAFIVQEDIDLLRIDYLTPCGWEDTCIKGKLSDLGPRKCRKIFDNFL